MTAVIRIVGAVFMATCLTGWLGFLRMRLVGLDKTRTAKTITVTMPSGTNLTALAAAFTVTGSSVKVGSTVQASGTTANGSRVTVMKFK